MSIVHCIKGTQTRARTGSLTSCVVVGGAPREEVYAIGIIDMLQKYGFQKQMVCYWSHVCVYVCVCVCVCV
jgi:hypothetical protein